MREISKELVGVTGEYAVAAELSRRGCIASVSLRNARGIDVLVTNETATRSVTIQVKANQGKKREWMLNKKCENIDSNTHFYVFVCLGPETQRPEFHIVPSQRVAEEIHEGHRAWLHKPGRGGQKHNDSPIRKFRLVSDEYLDRWNILGFG